MDRLTRRVPFGGYQMNDKTTNSIETIAVLRNALGKYEDEAEQREKGCEYCRNEKPLYHQHTEIINTNGTFDIPIYVKNTDYDFCPMCGRKLGDDNGTAR